MIAVSKELVRFIKQLQSLRCLNDSYLAGGTNLAIRYNHRVSEDIDLFFGDIIGRAGLDTVAHEIKHHFRGNVFNIEYPYDQDDQYAFLRVFLKSRNKLVKVEILQNMICVEKPEIVSDFKLGCVADIGMMKLVTAANRASFKDIYDLDYLTDDISLLDLFERLKMKQISYGGIHHQNIFSLDGEVSPISCPELLLKFELPNRRNHSRPDHSHNRLDVIPGNKSWMQARSSWRRKVRELFQVLGVEFPSIQPQ
jgi:hypothetical protein